MSVCHYCGARVRWCQTETDRRIPVDWQPDPRGKLVLTEEAGGVTRAVHEANARLVPTPNRYVAHFSTCPARPRSV